MKFRTLRVNWGPRSENSTYFYNVYLIAGLNHVEVQKDGVTVAVFYRPKACVEVG